MIVLEILEGADSYWLMILTLPAMGKLRNDEAARLRDYYER